MELIKLDKQIIEDLYLNKKLTQKQIADELSVSVVKISKFMKINNIQKFKFTEELLYNLYIEQNLTTKQIGDQFNVSDGTVSNHLKKFNIQKVTKIKKYNDIVCKLYKEQYSLYAINKETECSISTIITILENNKLRSNSDKKVYDNISKYELYNLYITENKTIAEIANILQTNVTNIFLHITHYKLNKKIIPKITKEILHKLYIVDNKKQYEVASILNLPISTVQNYIKKYNLNKSRSLIDTTIINKIKELNNNKLTIEEIANEIGFSRTYTGQVIKNLNIKRNRTRETTLEKFIKNILDKNGISYIQNDRYILEGKELDFYLIDYDIAIEVCGLYWHSTKFKNKDKYHIYHKYNLCKNLGFQLITIFEDEIIYKPDIVINRILSKLKLANTNSVLQARKCSINKILNKQGIAFLNKHHIQGSGANNSYYGAFYNDALKAVMSFSKSNIAKNNKKWELNRFASSNIIPGISNRLLSKFIQDNLEIKTIISYSDNRWDTGKIYRKLNFTHEYDSDPNYWYIEQQTRKHRFTYNKQTLLQHFDSTYSKYTEEHLTELINLYRIYDCGSKVFILETEKYKK